MMLNTMNELKEWPNDQKIVIFLNRIEDEQKRADGFELIYFLTEITGEAPKMWVIV